MKSVKGKYIWIIGASSGIGAALAVELAARGAIIALSARREGALRNVLEHMHGDGHIIVPADAADDESVAGAFQEIIKTFPKLDSAIFMAATYTPHDGEQKTLPIIKNMINVNLTGAFRMMDVAFPYFKKQETGQIVLCASVAGFRGLPTGQPYCATKAALISLAESLHVDFKPYGIDVKVINPGFVKTPLTDKNDFVMPMMIKPERAASSIANGLVARSFEIHFPKKLTLIMKILNILPNFAYLWISKKISPSRPN